MQSGEPGGLQRITLRGTFHKIPHNRHLEAEAAMSKEVAGLRLQAADFSDMLHAMSSEEWAAPAAADVLDRYNELLAEARRLMPTVALWPRRLHPTNEAEVLDI